MSHYSDDVHHRLSTRIRDIIPDFVESEYPAFVAFLKAYYEFLEQYDTLPIASTYTPQSGVVTVRSGNSIILGQNTEFSNTSVYANNVVFRVGSDEFRIRSVANNTELLVYDIPIRSYFANTHTVETNKSTRQAAGALRQILTLHDVDQTIDDFIAYFRDTYLRNLPQGLTDTSVLLPRILDFYQARGSEASYNFLFRALYGKDVKFSYPRDSVFTTSDNEWVQPIILRLDYSTAAVANTQLRLTGNVARLETREIIGLTSNARATVLQTVIAYEGSRRVVRMFIDEPVVPQETGGLLLEDGGQLIVTKFGIPPEGLESTIYEFNLIRDEIRNLTFTAGEIISTVPTNDPDRITGQLVGTINGFTIERRGVGYAVGDFVYPPSRFANGEIFTGGFGAVGRINALSTIDITEVNIDNPGLGYYAGLPLIVDNTGTGGGTGLQGYVAAVAPGNLILHDDPANANGVSDGDILTFTFETDELDYEASREKIDYYEVGVSLDDMFGGLRLNSDVADDDGDDLLDETDSRQLLQETAVVVGATSWSLNTGSAVYGANLSTSIVGLTSNLSVYPIYISGVRTELGKVSTITIESFGSGYVSNVPSIGVQTPLVPTLDVTGLEPLTYIEIFGSPFETAELSVDREGGQIAKIDVLKGGSGYVNAAFFLSRTAVDQLSFITEDGSFVRLEDTDGYLLFNAMGGAGYAATTDSVSGNGAMVAMTLGAIDRGESYFRNTKSFASADQYLQDVTKYQPFSYVLTVEEDLSRYATVLRQLVHPAGGLLLPRQTVTVDLDLESVINLEGIDYSFLIEETLLANGSYSLKTITITAPTTTANANINLATGTLNINIIPPTTLLGRGLLVGPPVVNNTAQSASITSSVSTISLELALSVNTAQIAASAETVTEHQGVLVATNTLQLTNEEETAVLGISVATAAITSTASAISVSSRIPVSAAVIRVTNEEETELLVIPVAASSITMTAPTVNTHLAVPVAVNAINLTAPEEQGLDVRIPEDAAIIEASAPTAVSAPTVTLSITFDTIIQPYDAVQISPYEPTVIITFANWEAPPIYVTAPVVSVTTTP